FGAMREWHAQIEQDMALGASGQFALSEELKMLSL
ncbi:cell division protein MraZ, partial [Pasteurella multocida subsp. multocida str. Anand1_buffalo]